MKILKSETYISFSLKKEFVKENKSNTYMKSYSLRFTYSARLMNASLDYLLNNLSKGIFIFQV